MADLRLSKAAATTAGDGGGGGDATWRRDVRVTTTQQLTTTGGTVWGAAHRAIQYLEAEAAPLGLLRPGVRVLELGAGCGLLALTVARNCPDAGEVCLTERAFGGALAHLRANVDNNLPLFLREKGGGCPATTTAALDWTHARAYLLARQQQEQQPASEPQPPVLEQSGDSGGGGLRPTDAELADLRRVLGSRWDLVIGSDLVYDAAGAEALPVLLAALLKEQPQHGAARAARSTKHGANAGAGAETAPPPPPFMIYAHTKHRYDAVDEALFDNLRRAGLTITEVAERGREAEVAAAAAGSPPPFSELWPELRCAVFRISAAEAAD